MPCLTGISILYQCRPEGGQGDVHPIYDAAIAWTGDRIAWVGPAAQLPAAFRDGPAFDAGGRTVIPGLIDCHTHLAFAGWRAEEFEQKLKGASYLEIARAGGGIVSTVRKTREAPAEALVTRCLDHLGRMLALGVTTVEAKSGYGLDLANELKLLEVYRDVASRCTQRLVPTLLAAHTTPPEYKDRRADYVRLVIDEIIPAAARAGLARFCDVFVEETAFSIDDARAIFAAGRRLGLVPKLHADQITDTGGAALAAEVGAVSADHLERSTDSGLRAMAGAGVVAVTLPLASLYLNQPPVQARRLRESGVRVAVATDFNPGSAPSYDLPLALMLACTLQRMTPAEALKGATAWAAHAIGEGAEVGSLLPGRRADLVLLEAESVEQWLYHYRPNCCAAVVAGGQAVVGALSPA